MTKEEYDRQNAKRPKKPGPLHWMRSKKAAEMHDHIFEGYQKAALDPYHFEELARYRDHLFEKSLPDEEPNKSPDEIVKRGYEAAYGAMRRIFGGDSESGEADSND